MATPGTPAGTQSTLSEWSGDYVTDMLGKSWAEADSPYQAYYGPLTAGATGNQQSAFEGIAGLAVPDAVGMAGDAAGVIGQNIQDLSYAAPENIYQAGDISTGAFTDQGVAQSYMNPYLQAALNPSLDEARRQAEISRINDAGRMTQAGAFGGSRQAILEAENNRNLMDKQNQMLTQGYASAYDKAQQAFTSDQARALQAQQAQEQFNQAEGQMAMQNAQFGAGYGLDQQNAALNAAKTQSSLGLADLGANMDILGEQARLGGIERGINQEGISADYAQFQQERDYPKEQLQFMQSMLQGMPIASRDVSYNDPSMLQQILAAGGGLGELFNMFKQG
jgi:hypothetical protein